MEAVAFVSAPNGIVDADGAAPVVSPPLLVYEAAGSATVAISTDELAVDVVPLKML